MSLNTPLGRRLGLDFPLVQAPMAGETATVELCIAAARAGILGGLGAAYFAPEKIREAIRRLHRDAPGRFAINLFIPEQWQHDPARAAVFARDIAAAHAALGLPAPAEPESYDVDFAAQLAVILEEAPPVFSFTFGAAEAQQIAALKQRGIFVIGTATTVAEAKELEARGVDAIVAQGAEAGGHRGTFLAPVAQSLIGTIALVPQVVDAVRVPVIAAGGIGDGRGIAAALCLGAEAAALGSALLLAAECGSSPGYRAALQGPGVTDTTLTRAFSGRTARGLRNTFVRQFEGRDEAIPPYPVPNAWTRPLRQAAAAQGNSEYLSLWAGQAAALARAEPVADIVTRVMRQAAACVRRP